MFITETDSVTVDTVTVQVNRVDTLASTTAVTNVLSDLVTGNNGNIVLRTTAGSIVLNDGDINGADEGGINGYAVSANGSGNILLSAGTTGSSIEAQAGADMVSTSGDISVVAANAITLGAGADILTGDTAGTPATVGTIDLRALAGMVDLSTTSNLIAGSGDIRVSGYVDVNLGQLISTTGNVAVYAETGSIYDADGDATTQDIQATGLKLNAAIGVGVLGATVNAIETTVTKLTARAASGGINVLEADDLIVDDVTVTVQNVALDASSTNLDGVVQ